MLEAWRGSAEVVLVGFLSYDLATEIEDLGPVPPPDFTFPQFYFALYNSAATLNTITPANTALANSTNASQPP